MILCFERCSPSTFAEKGRKRVCSAKKKRGRASLPASMKGGGRLGYLTISQRQGKEKITIASLDEGPISRSFRGEEKGFMLLIEKTRELAPPHFARGETG